MPYHSGRIPFSIVHFVTNRCNARCRHCFIDFNTPNSTNAELSLEEVEFLTKNLKGGIFNVNLTGGEPLLRKDLSEIAEAYLVNASAKSVFISTNGSYPGRIRRFLDRIVYSGPGKEVIFSVSIDGVGRKHDEIRNMKGLYQNALKTYRMVRDCGRANIRANVSITVTPDNLATVSSLYEHLIAKEGVSAVTATLMREQGSTKRICPEDRKRLLRAYSKVTRMIREDILSERLEGYGQDLLGTIMNAKNHIMNRILRQTYLDPHYISPCPAGALFGVIGAQGGVYPCEMLNESMGNLRDYDFDFMRIWQSHKAQKMREYIIRSRCHCTYECAWTVNILSNKRYLFPLGISFLKQKLRGNNG